MTSSDGLSGHVDRRTFLSALVATVPAGIVRPEIQESAIPIIDTHIHLFDQTRPHGAPYAGGRPPGITAPTLPSYPSRYRALARPLGIVGAIAVEPSPWVEDNLWVLQVAQTDTMVVGVIGNLEPDKPEFAEYLDRYRKNSLFLSTGGLVFHGENPGSFHAVDARTGRSLEFRRDPGVEGIADDLRGPGAAVRRDRCGWRQHPRVGLADK